MHVRMGINATGNGACLYDGQSHPLLRVEGWHAPAGRRTCEPPASCPGRADQTGRAGGCQKTWGPADRSFRRTTRAASAASEVRPGPRPPTLCPRDITVREAGPEALSTVSLPIRIGGQVAICASRCTADHPVMRSSLGVWTSGAAFSRRSWPAAARAVRSNAAGPACAAVERSR